MTWRERYAPFGEELLNPAANANNTAYTGHLKDDSTGLNYMQARYYDPILGVRRYSRLTLSTDPIGYQDQLNLYAYVANDPVNRIDPTGMCFENTCPFNVTAPLETQVAVNSIEDQAGAPAALAASAFFAGVGLAVGGEVAFGFYIRNALASNTAAAIVAGEGVVLTRPQKSAIDTIDNVLANNAKPHDFMGVLKQGMGIKSHGDHIKEMKQSVKALNGSIKSLQGSLNNPKLSDETRGALSSQLTRATQVRDLMKDHLRMAETCSGTRICRR